MQPSSPIGWLWCQSIANAQYMDPLGLYNSDFIDGLIQPIFRSNVLGTRFTVYDGGENPEKKPFVKECESLRQELAAICYVSLKWLLQSRNVLSNTKTRGKNFASVFAGSKRVRFKRPQKDDSDHPWYVGERRKSLNLPKKRKCNTSSFFFFLSFGHTWLCVKSRTLHRSLFTTCWL